MITDWQTKKLGEVCDIVNGGTPDTKTLSYWGNDHFWITPKDMGVLESIFVDTTPRKITNEGLKNSSAKLLPSSSIILSSRAPIGYLAINVVPIATNQGCKGLIPKKELDYLFLFYFLFNSVDLLNRLGSGTTFKELSGSKLSEVQIHLPPLPEQYRIVKILDEVFADVEKAKKNAEKKLQNAKELFESYLHSYFSNPTRDWGENDFESCIDKVVYTNKIQRNKFLKIGEFPIISQEKSLINGYWNRKDDLFKIERPVTIFGDHTKILKYIDFDFVLGADGVKILQPRDIFYPKFFYYALKSIGLKELGYARHFRLLKEKRIYYPKSLLEQEVIVAKLDSLSAETKKLEAIYKQKLTNLDEFRKSILKKAFSGEL